MRGVVRSNPVGSLTSGSGPGQLTLIPRVRIPGDAGLGPVQRKVALLGFVGWSPCETGVWVDGRLLQPIWKREDASAGVPKWRMGTAPHRNPARGSAWVHLDPLHGRPALRLLPAERQAEACNTNLACRSAFRRFGHERGMAKELYHSGPTAPGAWDPCPDAPEGPATVPDHCASGSGYCSGGVPLGSLQFGESVPGGGDAGELVVSVATVHSIRSRRKARSSPRSTQTPST